MWSGSYSSPVIGAWWRAGEGEGQALCPSRRCQLGCSAALLPRLQPAGRPVRRTGAAIGVCHPMAGFPLARLADDQYASAAYAAARWLDRVALDIDGTRRWPVVAGDPSSWGYRSLYGEAGVALFLTEAAVAFG